MMRRNLLALGLALALAVPVPAEDFQGQADLEQRQMHGRPEDAADPEGAALRADMEAGVVPGAALAKRVAGAYAFDKDAGATRELSRIMYGQDGRPPPSIGTLVGLARALTGEKYGKYAETAVRRALALDPGNPGAYRELARILADRGAWEAAADAEHQANVVSKVPDEAGQVRLLVYLGLALHAEGYLDAARDVVDDPATQQVRYEPFRKLRDSLRGKKFDWGLVLENLGKGVPGVRARTVARGSAADAAGLAAGDQLDKIGTRRVADEQLANEALEQAPLGGEVLFVIRREGKILSLTGIKSDRAARIKAEALNSEGVDRAKSKDFAGALELFRRAAAVDPHLGKSWYNIGLVRDAEHDYPGAVAGYLSGLALGLDAELAAKVRSRADELIARIGSRIGEGFPPEVHRLCATGSEMALQERYARGLFSYLEARQASPGFPNALLGAGILECTLGMRSAGVRDLRAFLRVMPGASNRRQVEEQIRTVEAEPPLPPVPIQDTSPWAFRGTPASALKARGPKVGGLFGGLFLLR